MNALLPPALFQHWTSHRCLSTACSSCSAASSCSASSENKDIQKLEGLSVRYDATIVGSATVCHIDMLAFDAFHMVGELHWSLATAAGPVLVCFAARTSDGTRVACVGLNEVVETSGIVGNDKQNIVSWGR